MQVDRRKFLGGALGAAGVIAAGGVGYGAGTAIEASGAPPKRTHTVPFYGRHQAGIATPAQDRLAFAAFDVTAADPDALQRLLGSWAAAAAQLTKGEPIGAVETAPQAPPIDTGEAMGLSAASLTITVGFGPSLFDDRFGLKRKRPEALADIPPLPGDTLDPNRSGGDLCVQACADDPQVAFHAIRNFARLARGTAVIRWSQLGFGRTSSTSTAQQTERNLMGFKDGTMNPPMSDPAAMNEFVWAGSEGPAWMNGGTYTVVRRIRITLEHWDNTELGFQEQVVGRHKYSGAPLGQKDEFEALDLDAADKDGNPVIPDNSHARLASPQVNNGAQILRRAYSYNDSTSFYIERWPPWRQQTEYDAGLMFVAHQRDPRKGFIPINEKLSKLDIMNQFTTHVGSAIFACPPGAQPGSYIGAALFDA